MGEKSKISWCHNTFNPWIGCTKVSNGCTNCYAERDDGRRKWTPDGWGKGKPRKRTSESNWKKPLKWNREAAAQGQRLRVFCASLADVFDDEVPDQWRHDLFKLIRNTPNLDWMLLTKRPETMRTFISDYFGTSMPYPNIWLGVSVEDQETADARIPILLQTPAMIRWISAEPLLGPVEFDCGPGAAGPHRYLSVEVDHPEDRRLDWIIVGGESGPEARPMHPDWARSIRDQCIRAGVAFHMKQWGEWGPASFVSFHHSGDAHVITGQNEGRYARCHPFEATDTSKWVYRIGKKYAGRKLDGRIWDEFPRAPQEAGA